METEDFSMVISVLFMVLLMAWFVISSVLTCYQRYFIPNRYAWLEFLSENEWKHAFQLQEEMRARVGISGFGVIRYDLDLLEMEGLIEVQWCGACRCNGYKLTHSGDQRKRSIRSRPASRFLFPRTV